MVAIRFFIAALVAWPVFSFAQSPSKTCTLTPSVGYREYSYTDSNRQPIHAYVLSVDLNDPLTRIQPLTGCKTPSKHGSSNGALATVNGGFFDGRCKSVSLLKLAGQMKVFAARERSAFGVDSQNLLHISKIGPRNEWPGMQHALGGIGRLVTDGQLDVNAEGGSSGFANSRHPRTAIGLVDDHHALIVVVDGRNKKSAGMNLKQLGQFMLSLGARWAMNLDGGGSSAMWIDPGIGDADGVVNKPSDGHENSVATAVGVFSSANSKPKCF